jgi:acid phosphatase (class A)
MNLKAFCSLATTALMCTATFAQDANPTKPSKAPKTAYFIDAPASSFSLVIPQPPAAGSDAAKADLAELHKIEQARTPAEAAVVRADEKEDGIFIFRSVLGEKFNAENLPLTTALSEHVLNDESVVASALKGDFKRQRPYQVDATLRPVCNITDKPNSYPSGHSLTAYLEALTLAQIVPEKRQELLARADEFAYHRMVCGVHYPTDIAAGRNLAYAVFGNMLGSQRFQADLMAARSETRKLLGLD